MSVEEQLMIVGYNGREIVNWVGLY